MKDRAYVDASIDRFRRGFWGRECVDHPPVGIVPARTWLPIGYLKAGFDRPYVTPTDVSPALVRTDYEDAAIGRGVTSDDWLPYSAPWRALPWLEALCGCAVRYATGSLAPEAWVDGPEALAGIAGRVSAGWWEALWEQTRLLAAALPDDCFSSPTILRGPSDVLAAMRGLSNFYFDLHDNPGAIRTAAAAVNRLLIDVLVRHFALTPPKLGGYGNIYGYWAPGPSYVLQEDVLGMAAPRVYRDSFMELNAQVIARLGGYNMFHLHSTGLRHYRHVMDVPGLAGLEITIEANGPSLRDLTPILGEIMERTRLVLFVDEFFEDLPGVLRNIPHDGLYVIISDKFIDTDRAYRDFIGTNWPGR